MSGSEPPKSAVPPQITELLSASPEIEIVEAFLPDLNGKLRGKWIPRSKIETVFAGGLKMPLSTLGFDVWGRDPFAWVYDDGDADGICEADADSLALVPWLKRPTAQILLSLKHVSGEPCNYDPRVILRQLSKRFNQHGLTPVLATEMEFFLFRNDSDAAGRPVHTQMTFGGETYGIDAMQAVSDVMHGIRDACAVQNLPVDTLITEAAPSQYEINLFHQADALLAADQGMLLQRAIKGVAGQHDMRASFMAKPFSELAGNGMHVHCSLLNEVGANAFDNGTDEGGELLRQAIAGCLATMADSMLLFAPHLNSYRRFQVDSHAPMAPTWGYDNRTVAVRVPADSHKAMRLEHRLAGADASPHLVIAAIMAGMLYGIENELQAASPVVGDAYRQYESELPNSWPDALKKFSQSEFIGNYLGQEFQRIYASTKRQEITEFASRMTPFEYQTYL